MKVSVLEHSSCSYGPRTYVNAAKGDVTIALAVDYSTAGERLTHKAAGAKYLQLPLNEMWIDNARTLYRYLREHPECKCINVAGNGIYTLNKHAWTQGSINNYVYNMLKQVVEFIPIEKIVSGGQTGVDIAGGIAGAALGLEVELLLPKGFVQRGVDMLDRTHTREDIMEQVFRGEL